MPQHWKASVPGCGGLTLSKPSSWHYACQETVPSLGRMISGKLVGCKHPLLLGGVLGVVPRYTQSMCRQTPETLYTQPPLDRKGAGIIVVFSVTLQRALKLSL